MIFDFILNSQKVPEDDSVTDSPSKQFTCSGGESESKKATASFEMIINKLKHLNEDMQLLHISIEDLTQVANLVKLIPDFLIKIYPGSEEP